MKAVDSERVIGDWIGGCFVMSSLENGEIPIQMFVIHRNDLVYVELPAMRLVGKGSTVQEAYDDVVKQRTHLLAAYREADILDHLPDASDRSAGGPAGNVPLAPARSLKSFALKSGIVAGVIAVVLLVLSSVVTNQISKKAAELNIGGREFRQNMERQLAKAANSSKQLPKEQREKIAADLEKLAMRIKPYIDAISKGLSDGRDDDKSLKPESIEPRP